MAADRLRELIDLVVTSLDDGADGRALAERAHFSRDHLDRLLAGATGETPVALRRRLLLERAAWQLAHAPGVEVGEVARAAGYGSHAAFTRAFARAFGAPPTAYAGPHRLAAPNEIHFHPPGGLLLPAPRGGGPSDRRHPTIRQPTDGLAERMVAHHLDRTRELLTAAEGLPAAALARELRPGFVAVWFEGEEPNAALMAERLVFTLEVWVAAMGGEPRPETAGETLLQRFDRAAPRFARLARRVAEEGAYDDAFVDALCEPPQSFTYGGVLAHNLTFGAVRREMLAQVLAELGVTGLQTGDPVLWEEARLKQ